MSLLDRIRVFCSECHKPMGTLGGMMQDMAVDKFPLNELNVCNSLAYRMCHECKEEAKDRARK